MRRQSVQSIWIFASHGDGKSAVLLAMMLIVRNFKGAFENTLSGDGCSSKATAKSVGLTMHTDRSMLNILVTSLFF